VLAVVYGINAPFVYMPGGENTSLRLVIVVYLVARASFVAALAFQCFFLPIVSNFQALKLPIWMFPSYGIIPHSS
jgi:hypothetical protein